MRSIRSSIGNLEDFHAAKKEIPYEKWSSFHLTFIGALSCHVSQDDWRFALNSAKKVVEEMR